MEHKLWEGWRLFIVAEAVRYKLIKKTAATKCCRSQFVI